MSSTIIKFILGILLTFTVILYPIGKTLSDPVNINNALTSIEFEQKFLDVFKEVTVQQLSTTTGQSREAILDQIKGDLISKDDLKKQREEQVVLFFKSLEEGKVPNFKLEIENPISKFTSSIKDKAQDFLNNVKNIQICTKGDDSLLCRTFGDTINSLLGRDKEGNVLSDSTNAAAQPSFTFETSLGIDENNIQNWSSIYKVLRYGPDALLGLCIALITIYYLLTWPKTKAAVSELIQVIKVDVFAFAVWGLIPLIFNVANPIQITSQADIQGNVNLVIGGAISEIGKNALIVPIIFTVISVVMVLLTIVIPKLSVSRITGESGKIEGVKKYDESKADEQDGDEGEEEDEEETVEEKPLNTEQKGSAIKAPAEKTAVRQSQKFDPKQPLNEPISKKE